MNENWQVTGRVRVEWQTRNLIQDVNETVPADSAEQAKDIAKMFVADQHLRGVVSWIGKPTVTLITEAEMMRRLGAPTLPGLE